MEAHRPPRPEKEIAEAMRLTPASEHSYPCAFKSNLKLGPRLNLQTPAPLRSHWFSARQFRFDRK